MSVVAAELDPEADLSADRARILRFCRRLTGDVDAAQDLAQETLLEAWRHGDELRDPASRLPWLFGIARNIHLRWVRGRCLEQSQFTPLSGSRQIEPESGDDLELELERSELAELLDRALALLPADMRDVLLQRYIADRSHADIAHQLRVSEGTVAVRVHRGRIALRRVLVTRMPDEAASYGLVAVEADAWQASRIWCSTCGMARMSARVDRVQGSFTLRCPACRSEMQDRSAPFVREVQGFTRMMIRAQREAHILFRTALSRGQMECSLCNRAMRVRPSLPPEYAGGRFGAHGIHFRCDRCDIVSFQPASGLALTHPAVERFWRKHRRMRTTPPLELDLSGRKAIITTFESVTDQARISVIAGVDTFDVLTIVEDR